jgi:hypothetical protein
MDLPPLGSDKAEWAAQLVLGKFGAPAYMRRSQQMENAVDQLLIQCRRQRSEWSAMVGLRLGVLHGLAGDWRNLVPLLVSETELDKLEQLHADLRPQLRLPVEPTTSKRCHRNALLELRASIVRFNRRWIAYLGEVNLGAVNTLIDGYNRYYVLEKECVVRSAAIARQGFRPREPLTLDRLTALLPPLPLPQLKS